MPMEMSLEGSGKMIKKYMDFIDSKMGQHLKAGSNSTTSAMESWSMKMANPMRVSLKMGKDMVQGLTGM
jgi:hypothetical protein